MATGGTEDDRVWRGVEGAETDLPQKARGRLGLGRSLEDHLTVAKRCVNLGSTRKSGESIRT
jgi:hypothetical protein